MRHLAAIQGFDLLHDQLYAMHCPDADLEMELPFGVLRRLDLDNAFIRDFSVSQIFKWIVAITMYYRILI